MACHTCHRQFKIPEKNNKNSNFYIILYTPSTNHICSMMTKERGWMRKTVTVAQTETPSQMEMRVLPQHCQLSLP